ncbi:hypothetical protein ACFVZ9_20105, partial [Streptomyces zaomyceticus]
MSVGRVDRVHSGGGAEAVHGCDGYGRDGHGLRIVRLANFVTPTSGGLRTALDRLGRGYRAAGHEPVLVVAPARTPGRPTPPGRRERPPPPPQRRPAGERGR